MPAFWAEKLAFLQQNNVSATLEVQLPEFGTEQWDAFVRNHVNNAIVGHHRLRCCIQHQRVWHLLHALSKVPPALRLTLPRAEFGVRDAFAIRVMANSSDEERGAQWHGFDSFLGLPPSESAEHSGSKAGSKAWKAGRFTTEGKLPAVAANTWLHAGWFNETLASFFMTAQEEAAGRAISDSQGVDFGFAFVHMDADIYESTVTVLDLIFGRCWYRKGSVFAFDELFGPAFQAAHEFRALTEASARHRVRWHFVSYHLTPSSMYARAAVQIDSQCADGVRRRQPLPQMRRWNHN